MTQNYEDPRPISQQIAADLRAQILSGDLAESLPSFSQLAATYGASVNACQNAVQILKDERLVSGRQGVGLTVTRPEVTVIEAGAYFEPRRGHLKYDLIEVGAVAPPVGVAALLGGHDPALMRKQVMSVEGQPVELVRNFYPLAIAAGSALEGQGKVTGGAHRVLASLGAAPRRLVDVLSDRQPTRDEMKHLRLPGYASVIQTLRVVYDVDSRPVEVSILVKGGHRTAVQYSVDLH